MSCDACQALTIQDLLQRANDHPAGSKTGWNQAGYLVLHSSFRALIKNAENGCPNCKLYLSQFLNSFGESPVVLEEALKSFEDSGRETPVIAFLALANWDNGNGWQRYITKVQLQLGAKPWGAGDESRMCITFKVYDEALNEIDAIENAEFEQFNFRYTEIDYDLASDANFKLAKKWTQTCCTEHESKLCPPIIDHELPTRLIDVGLPDGSQTPRLIVTAKRQKGRYLALSHCWGTTIKGPRVTTTLANLQERQKEIPMAILPANFRDAVTVTRKLGYRYVWIDSLCIIQDSVADWEAESSRMGDIYTRASLTIAAAAANSSDGGMLETHYEHQDFKSFAPSKWFLIDRKETNRYALLETTTHNEQKFEKCYINLSKGASSPKALLTPWMAFSDLEENWFRCVVVGPLAHRGWTLQERTLSYRTLYYGKRQIYWQCPSSRKAADGENLPVSASTSVWNLSSDHSEWPNVLGLRDVDFESDPDAELTVHQIWRNVLKIYASRRLTKQTDKLPALAGMAAFVHNVYQDEYIAGFWLKDLLVSLVWTPVPIWGKGHAMRDYQISKPNWEMQEVVIEGPSWSWAGADIQDRLDFWAATKARIWRGKDAQVLSHNLEVVGSNPFGKVKSGKLVLKGLTYPRWDGRVEGWNPIVPGAGVKALFLDWWSEYTCLHSFRFDEDRTVLWDYPERHGKLFLLRYLAVFAQAVLSILVILLWPVIDIQASLGRAHDLTCPYCVRCTCLHILSVADQEERRDLKTGKRYHEISLWALILEPVKDQEKTYRRVGIAKKDVPIFDTEYLDFRGLNNAEVEEPPAPRLFSEWKVQSVTII